MLMERQARMDDSVRFTRFLFCKGIDEQLCLLDQTGGVLYMRSKWKRSRQALNNFR